MSHSEQDMVWAINWLTRSFASRPGFPKSDEELELDARDLLDLVHRKTVGEIVGKPKEECGAWTREHYGEQDVVWLEREARRQGEFYPRPSKLRSLYCRHLRPADNIEGEVEE